MLRNPTCRKFKLTLVPDHTPFVAAFSKLCDARRQVLSKKEGQKKPGGRQ
jgi:hypothetical protein